MYFTHKSPNPRERKFPAVITVQRNEASSLWLLLYLEQISVFPVAACLVTIVFRTKYVPDGHIPLLCCFPQWSVLPWLDKFYFYWYYESNMKISSIY